MRSIVIGRRDRLITAGHIITAFVLAVEGVSHLEHHPVPWGFVALCWSGAVAIILVTAWHHQLEARFPALTVVVYAAEGSVCSALAYLTHHAGKVYLPFVWLVAALCLFARAVFEFRRAGARRSAPAAIGTVPGVQTGPGTDV